MVYCTCKQKHTQTHTMLFVQLQILFCQFFFCFLSQDSNTSPQTMISIIQPYNLPIRSHVLTHTCTHTKNMLSRSPHISKYFSVCACVHVCASMHIATPTQMTIFRSDRFCLVPRTSIYVFCIGPIIPYEYLQCICR